MNSGGMSGIVKRDRDDEFELWGLRMGCRGKCRKVLVGLTRKDLAMEREGNRRTGRCVDGRERQDFCSRE